MNKTNQRLSETHIKSVIALYSNGQMQEALDAIDTLAERYENAGKTLHLVHLSEECRSLLTKAGSLVEVNVIEDPKYFVAEDSLA